MFGLGKHWAYIVWAYGISLGGILLLALCIVADYRRQVRRLADLDGRADERPLPRDQEDNRTL